MSPWARVEPSRDDGFTFDKLKNYKLLWTIITWASFAVRVEWASKEERGLVSQTAVVRNCLTFRWTQGGERGRLFFISP